MKQRAALMATVSTVALAAAAGSALAVTTAIDFDDKAPGTTLTTEGAVTFIGSPSVFVPTHVATRTPPNALHSAGSCGVGSTCPSGNNLLDIRFDHPVGSVSWDVGFDDEPAAFEFGEIAELEGFAADGTRVTTSGDRSLGDSSYFPITATVTANSNHVDIVRALLTVGKYGTPKRVNVDHLVFTDNVAPVPPAPAVSISVPTPDRTFDRIDDIRVTGTTTVPAGVHRFCIRVTPEPLTDFPADCADNGLLGTDGRFTDVRTGPFVSGTNHISAWIEDLRMRQVHVSVPIVVRDTDLRVSNMEVTQAVQSELPVPTPEANDVAHTAEYNGVPLLQGKTTIARVWTAARLDAGGAPIRGVAVYLYGLRADGTPLPRGPITPLEGVRNLGPALSFGPPIGPATWANPASSWTFVIPSDWTSAGPISLRAVVNPPAAYPRVNECAGCEANNELTLSDISFRRPRTLQIWPYRVIWRDSAGAVQAPRDRGYTEAPYDVFSTANAASPFTYAVHPYLGVIGAQSIADSYGVGSDEANDGVANRLFEAIDIAGYRGFHTVALNVRLARGLNITHWSWSSFTVRNYSIIDVGRPLTSVAHETYHAIGFEHAGRGCAGAVAGGGAVSWPPDDRGLLQSVGTDVRPVYARTAPTVYGSFDAAGNAVENFDFMSYCAPNNPDSNTWISAANYRSALDRAPSRRRSFAPAVTHTRSRAANGPTLAVNAVITPDGGRILRVEPGGPRVGAPPGGDSIRIRVRDAAGTIVSDTPVQPGVGHADAAGRQPSVPVLEVAAVVPAAGAATVELVEGGAVLDTRSGSAHAPRARLISPRARARIRPRGNVTVRWKATDADGDTLVKSLDYSADGGRRWRAVALGLTGSTYALPARLLQGSRRGRLRLRVSDGWHMTSVLSAPLRVDGPPPSVSILAPGTGARISADQVINLIGSAFDDRSHALTGRRLRWYDERRALGRGAQLSVLGLRAGRRTIRLVATDRRGRRSTARVRVRVQPVTPRFLELSAPASVSPSARRVVVRAASSVAATLRSGKQRFPIDRRTRTYRIRIRPGTTALRIPLALGAGKRRTRTTVAVLRS